MNYDTCIKIQIIVWHVVKYKAFIFFKTNHNMNGSVHKGHMLQEKFIHKPQLL